MKKTFSLILVLMATSVFAKIGDNRLYYMKHYGKALVTGVIYSKVKCYTYIDLPYKITAMMYKGKTIGILVETSNGTFINPKQTDKIIRKYIFNDFWKRESATCWRGKTSDLIVIYTDKGEMACFTNRLLKFMRVSK